VARPIPAVDHELIGEQDIGALRPGSWRPAVRAATGLDSLGFGLDIPWLRQTRGANGAPFGLSRQKVGTSTNRPSCEGASGTEAIQTEPRNVEAEARLSRPVAARTARTPGSWPSGRQCPARRSVHDRLRGWGLATAAPPSERAAEVPHDGTHVAMRQLVPGPGESIRELIRILVEAPRNLFVDRVERKARSVVSMAGA